jgi:hypothetical protein
MSWRAFFDVRRQAFFLKGHRKGVERRIERGDASLVAVSDLIQTEDHTGRRVMSNITEAVRRLVEGCYISDTDGKKRRGPS